MRIMLVGGGTGGHFYPLMAVAEELNDTPEKPELYYIGPSQYERDELFRNSITYLQCPAGKVRRYFSIANFADAFKTTLGFFVALYQLFRIYPDVVFSKGSYTSVPVLLAAKVLLIPIVIHESDATPSRATKLGAKLARFIGIAYDELAEVFPAEKTALVGIPIRRQVQKRYPKEAAKNALGIPNDRALIYVTGGSSGAERLNNQVLDALPKLLKTTRVFHQVGVNNQIFFEERTKAVVKDKTLLDYYYLQGHLEAETVSLILSAADLVISRAGSTTLFELALHEVPAILVPIPETISHDQRSNAYAYARAGAAMVVEEENVTDNLLIQEINTILKDQTRYQNMVAATRTMQYPDAASKLANILIAIGKEHGS
jgi:UDP-N-acetylglucosamine--N-acetylmuramyl-(pentapeptide) pyrophosphoryl-undecaprenol N-acetylglucosamine transferase